jgi:isocitrate/methylisocitrate lyase
MTPTRTAKDASWNSPRWKGITRPYTHADVDRLKGSVHVEHSLARTGAEKFWKLLRNDSFIPALGALNGSQAAEMAQAGLKAVYISSCALSGRRDADIPAAVREANSALLHADQVAHSQRRTSFDWMLPIVAEGDTDFGGTSSFETMKALIEAGAAAVHFDDQLAGTRRCDQALGKVLIPIEEMIQKLVAARLAADSPGVSTVLIARTDAADASYISGDSDPRDQRFITGENSGCYNGSYNVFRGGMDAAVARALAYAPYADLLWCETAELNLDDARKFANAIHAKFPGKMLAYNCSPSFHWRAKLNEDDIACFQRDLAAMGYRFQFISLAGYHTLNLSMYQFAKDYAHSGMTAYSQIQQLEIEMAKQLGHTNIRSQEKNESAFLGAISAAIQEQNKTHRSTHRLRVVESFERDGVDYNDGEATERAPMPHLYPSLRSLPRPRAAAAD